MAPVTASGGAAGAAEQPDCCSRANQNPIQCRDAHSASAMGQKQPIQARKLKPNAALQAIVDRQKRFKARFFAAEACHVLRNLLPQAAGFKACRHDHYRTTRLSFSSGFQRDTEDRQSQLGCRQSLDKLGERRVGLAQNGSSRHR